jgi:hypothetical protein
MSISYVENGDSGLVARTLINQAIDGVNSGSFPYTGSAKITGSLSVTGSTISTLGFTGSLQGTSSYALTASYVANASSFPFTGSAIISGSLVVTGSILSENQTISGSIYTNGTITFSEQPFISSTYPSGNIYISALNAGILHLNDDGGEGDIRMLNGQGSKLHIKGDTIITGSLIATERIKSTGSLILQPNENDNRYLEIYNTSPQDTHITASGGLIYLGDDTTYVKVDNYYTNSKIIEIRADGGLTVTGSLNMSGSLNVDAPNGEINLTGSLKLSGGGITGAGTGVMFIDSNNIVSNMVHFSANSDTITGGDRGTMNLANLGIGGSASGLIIPTTSPSVPDTGSMYFDAPSGKLYIYDGTQWLQSVFVP